MNSKVVIDRRTWYRGKGSWESRLVRAEDSHKCCLGFKCIQDGIPEKRLIGITLLATGVLKGVIDKSEIPEAAMVLVERPRIANDIADINDDVRISDSDRESQITALFKEHFDQEVEFIN